MTFPNPNTFGDSMKEWIDEVDKNTKKSQSRNDEIFKEDMRHQEKRKESFDHAHSPCW